MDKIVKPLAALAAVPLLVAGLTACGNLPDAGKSPEAYATKIVEKVTKLKPDKAAGFIRDNAKPGGSLAGMQGGDLQGSVYDRWIEPNTPPTCKVTDTQLDSSSNDHEIGVVLKLSCRVGGIDQAGVNAEKVGNDWKLTDLDIGSGSGGELSS